MQSNFSLTDEDNKLSRKTIIEHNRNINQIRETIDELTEAILAQSILVEEDELTYNQMFIDLLKKEINGVFWKLCFMFHNRKKYKRDIMYVFDVLKKYKFSYAPIRSRIENETHEIDMIDMPDFHRFVRLYYNFLNDTIIPQKKEYFSLVINCLQQTSIVDDTICEILSYVNKPEMITRKEVDTMVYGF
jgi:hypothetical protein